LYRKASVDKEVANRRGQECTVILTITITITITVTALTIDDL
jgi:hypothetical protein